MDMVVLRLFSAREVEGGGRRCSELQQTLREQQDGWATHAPVARAAS